MQHPEIGGFRDRGRSDSESELRELHIRQPFVGLGVREELTHWGEYTRSHSPALVMPTTQGVTSPGYSVVTTSVAQATALLD